MWADMKLNLSKIHVLLSPIVVMRKLSTQSKVISMN